MSGSALDPRLLGLLVCPLTRQPLRFDAKAQELVNDTAGLAYPIRDGVPILLPEAAREFLPNTG
ncbi:Trm112 family protein [Sandarakinorhabdus rubra]|uniref:Trm112 family protein n=1 Tax=Sandarakinorhabdus rubra TaxID=2672568 RepID=UPI0013DA73FB|nr:Trm112 family protein [Sandarakinorhabdus rubra]